MRAGKIYRSVMSFMNRFAYLRLCSVSRKNWMVKEACRVGSEGIFHRSSPEELKIKELKRKQKQEECEKIIEECFGPWKDSAKDDRQSKEIFKCTGDKLGQGTAEDPLCNKTNTQKPQVVQLQLSDIKEIKNKILKVTESYLTHPDRTKFDEIIERVLLSLKYKIDAESKIVAVEKYNSKIFDKDKNANTAGQLMLSPSTLATSQKALSHDEVINITSQINKLTIQYLSPNNRMKLNSGIVQLLKSMKDDKGRPVTKSHEHDTTNPISSKSQQTPMQHESTELYENNNNLTLKHIEEKTYQAIPTEHKINNEATESSNANPIVPTQKQFVHLKALQPIHGITCYNNYSTFGKNTSNHESKGSCSPPWQICVSKQKNFKTWSQNNDLSKVAKEINRIVRPYLPAESLKKLEEELNRTLSSLNNQENDKLMTQTNIAPMTNQAIPIPSKPTFAFAIRSSPNLASFISKLNARTMKSGAERKLTSIDVLRQMVLDNEDIKNLSREETLKKFSIKKKSPAIHKRKLRTRVHRLTRSQRPIEIDKKQLLTQIELYLDKLATPEYYKSQNDIVKHLKRQSQIECIRDFLRLEMCCGTSKDLRTAPPCPPPLPKPCPPKPTPPICPPGCVPPDPCAPKSSSDCPCAKKPDPCAKKPDPCPPCPPCPKPDPCPKKADPCGKKPDPCGKKPDPCPKPNPCPKPDPCPKADPCAKKPDPCPPLPKPDPCPKKADPCGKKPDPCGKKPDPCGKKPDPCPPCPKPAPCPKPDPCPKPNPCAKKPDPCPKKPDPCAKKADPCPPCPPKPDPCATKPNPCPCGNRQPSPTRKSAKKSICEHLRLRKKSASPARKDPCAPKKDPCAVDPCKPNPCKPEPCKPKEDPCKPKCDPCKPKDDPCKPKDDPCKPKSDPCNPKPDPCKPKNDPCKPKNDPCKPKNDPCAPKRDPACARASPCENPWAFKKDPCKPNQDPCKPKCDPCSVKKDPCAGIANPFVIKENPWEPKKENPFNPKDPCKFCPATDPCAKFTFIDPSTISPDLIGIAFKNDSNIIDNTFKVLGPAKQGTSLLDILKVVKQYSAIVKLSEAIESGSILDPKILLANSVDRFEYDLYSAWLRFFEAHQGAIDLGDSYNILAKLMEEGETFSK